jgi:hypothetical protein
MLGEDGRARVMGRSGSVSPSSPTGSERIAKTPRNGGKSGKIEVKLLKKKLNKYHTSQN